MHIYERTQHNIYVFQFDEYEHSIYMRMHIQHDIYMRAYCIQHIVYVCFRVPDVRLCFQTYVRDLRVLIVLRVLQV